MSSLQHSKEDPIIQGKIRQFKRLVISFNDFKYARDISGYIISENLYDDYDNQGLIISALSCSMIICYCRPFSGNDKRNKSKIPNLTDKAIKVLNSQELIVHKQVLEDRKKLLAHSDSDAIDVKFRKINVGDKILLQPVRNWSMAPLDKKNCSLFNECSSKLLSFVAEQRHKIEDEVVPYLDEKDFEIDL